MLTLLALGVGSASGQTLSASNEHLPIITVYHTSSHSLMTPNSACAITEYGHTGDRICGFDYSSITWSNGDVEWFVVGKNYAIWHIWDTAGSRRTLGGKASSAAPNGAYAFVGSANGVETIGTDGNYWCDYLDSSWSGWQRC